MIAVTVERHRYLQQHAGQTHAELVLPHAASRTALLAATRGEPRLQRISREFIAHDADGSPLGVRRADAGAVTVLRYDGPLDVMDLDLSAARGCGFRTALAAQAAWAARHPRSPIVLVVWYALGDWRDRDRFLAFGGRRAGADDRGYTQSRSRALDPDAPVPPEVADRYAVSNRQKDDARRAKASAALAAETPSQRLLRIERYIESTRESVGEEAARAVYSAIRQHLRVLEQRVTREERARLRRAGG